MHTYGEQMAMPFLELVMNHARRNDIPGDIVEEIIEWTRENRSEFAEFVSRLSEEHARHFFIDPPAAIFHDDTGDIEITEHGERLVGKE